MLGRWIRRAVGAGTNEQTFDIVFVSYPKTGTTWTRVMLGRYVQVLSGAKALPLFDGTPYDDQLRAHGLPTILFTHAPLDWDRQTARELTRENTVGVYAGSKVVLLARYPIDALVSNYMQWKHQVGRDVGTLPGFIADPVLGIEKLIAFYCIWAKRGGDVRGFRLLRYEDMHNDAAGALTALLEFLGIALDDDALADAVAFSSFSQMKEMQTAADAPVYPSSGLNIFGPIASDDPDAQFVRKGKVGGYRELLSADECDALERRIAREMDRIYGYDMPVGAVR